MFVTSIASWCNWSHPKRWAQLVFSEPLFFNSNLLMPPISIFITVCVAFANDDNAMIYCEVEYWCKVQPQKSTVETRRELLELSNYCDKTTLVTLPIFANISTAGHQHCKTRLWHFLFCSASVIEVLKCSLFGLNLNIGSLSY